jgi:hypothetical protein
MQKFSSIPIQGVMDWCEACRSSRSEFNDIVPGANLHRGEHNSWPGRTTNLVSRGVVAVHRSGNEMKRAAEIGLFAKASNVDAHFSNLPQLARGCGDDYCSSFLIKPKIKR